MSISSPTFTQFSGGEGLHPPILLRKSWAAQQDKLCETPAAAWTYPNQRRVIMRSSSSLQNRRILTSQAKRTEKYIRTKS